MAGDWLKMRTNLWDDPRVGRISDLTESSEAMVIGALYWLWTAADEHTEDGFMPGLSLRQIDRKTGLAGFGAALCDVGWLIDSPDGVTIARFEEHNGTSAKRRCTDAQRKANGRNVSASDADKERTEGGVEEDEKRRIAELEKEKRREESSSLRSEEGGRAARAPVAPSCPDDVSEQVWADWLSLRKRKRATVSATTVEGARDEAKKAGMTLEAFLRVWCTRGSQGLSADWVTPAERGQHAQPRASPWSQSLANTAAALTGRTPNASQQDFIDV